ncbi:MAG: ABC transporter permease [Ferrimicrobium sp.]
MARPVVAQARSEISLAIRQGEAALLTLIIPVLGLLVVASVSFVALPPGVPSRVNFALAGVVSFGIMAAGMVAQSIATAFDRNYCVLKRLGATPLGRRGVIVGKLAAVAVLELIQLVILVAVGVALGWHPEGNPLLFIFGWFFATSAFTGLGLIIGGTLRAEVVLGLSNLLMFVLVGVGAMAFPLSSLPGWLQIVAKLLPAAATSTVLLHGMSAGGTVPTWALINLLVWGIGAPLVAIRWFRWE